MKLVIIRTLKFTKGGFVSFYVCILNLLHDSHFPNLAIPE